ncbi:MAG: tRNA-guanine(15) transglycosylase [Methanosaeta sp. PtaU1.Bin060]|nr:MAG: tRNA-guanine(15) transglycosylase [Methanosaeta sp. PtaU1.Bin060]
MLRTIILFSNPCKGILVLRRARIIADYQFGHGAGDALIPEETTFSLSKTGRLRYLYSKKKRIATLRASDGFLTLSMLGAGRLHSFFKSPRLRVVASDDAASFIAKGGNLFAKHVLCVDPELRAGDEVLVVDSSDRLLATGTAVLAPEEMLQIKRGLAVQTRTAAEH